MATIKKRTAVFLVVVTVGVGLALNQGFSFGRKPERAPAAKRLPLVSITTSQTRDLPIEFTAQGHVVALNQVDVRPQLTGTIRSVDFHEGDRITAGQLLFTLDAGEATAQLNRVQAQAAQIRAQLGDANREHGRAKELVKANFISPSAVDTAASKVESLQAQLAASLADADNARVQISRMRITAPLAAQAGAVTVHPGSLAQQNATVPLVTLIQFDPIGVEFSLPEKDLNPILAARASAPVTVTLATPDGRTVVGKLTFINNTVSTDTGTINLKARFSNPKQILWPGSFARVTLRAGVSKGAVVLPPQAILEGPTGRFVYLVGSDDKVMSKPVTLLRIQDDAAVIDGLQGGERIVLEGGQNLRSGAAVRITNRLASATLPAATDKESGK